jgi:nicotinamidase-related amidase
MLRPLGSIRRRRILVDIDTQRDFLLSDGAACVRNHRRVLANIRRISAWARSKNICVVSTTQVYPNDNGSNRYHYCIDGTEGQKKIRYTLREKRTGFVADGSTDLPKNILRTYNQVIFNKRCLDPFNEPRVDRLLSEIRADEFILFGATTEGSVKATALGLLQRGKRVTVVTDATGSRDKNQAQLALRQMQAKGAKLIETKSLAGSSHLKQVGACHCERCQGLRKKDHARTIVNN